MDHQKAYHQLIDRAKLRGNFEGYKEKHHIIPRCLGGSNDLDNLVYLTAREHFICHWLLHRANPNERKLAIAFDRMAKGGNTTQPRYVPSSRVIAEAREASSRARTGMKKPNVSAKLKGRFVSEETKAKMSRARKGTQLGKVITDETRAKLVKAAKLKLPKTEQHKKNISLALKGRPVNKDAVAIQKNKDSVSKPILQYTKEGEFLSHWPSAQEAAKHIKIHYSVISHNLCGRAKSAGGFVWKFMY
jgi:hypothetical protein